MPTMQHELESARLTVVPWDTPFEILKGTYTRHRFAPHLHDTFALGAIEAGASKIRYRDRTVTQRAGDVVVIPPHEVHTGESDGPQGWSYRMLYLPKEVLVGFTTTDDLRFEGPSIADPELARRIVELHALLDAGTDRLRGQTALVDVLQMLCARHAGGSVDRSRDGRLSSTLRLVRDYLETNFAKSISLMELSALSGVSPFHLSRRFRARYGLPPYMYLELVRVNRAREMLRRGDPISRVAFDTGFSDQSHLTRRFKRVVGVPPGQYAKTYESTRGGEIRVA
jgi:AraC-like DNA-binding protein